MTEYEHRSEMVLVPLFCRTVVWYGGFNLKAKTVFK